MLNRSSLQAACEAAAKVNAVLIAKGKLNLPAPQIVKVIVFFFIFLVLKYVMSFHCLEVNNNDDKSYVVVVSIRVSRDLVLFSI